MRMSWVLCVLLGTLAWGQSAPASPPSGQPAQAPPPTAARPPAPATGPDTAASVPADAAVITVVGVCPPAPKAAAGAGTATKSAGATKTATADCKTVITKAEFEKLMSSIPNANPQMKKQIASVLPRLIAMSDAAKKKGLDKTPEYEEMVKIQKMQILSTELQRKVQEDAAKIPPADIEDYYKSNPEAFEQFTLDRLFIPRSKQIEPDKEEGEKDEKDEKLTPEQQKAKQDQEKAKAAEGEKEMTELAGKLRERAVAGEDFVKLQKEAFEAAGMKIESPSVTLPKVRRTGLPPAHAAIFDLKAGEVSQVISDNGGHYIYKVNSKEQLTLDQAKPEIQSNLQNQRTRDTMDKINSSFKVETNEAYFGPGGAGTAPPPRGLGTAPPPRAPRPAMAPGAPAGSPQGPPPTAQQTPSQPQAAKPN